MALKNRTTVCLYSVYISGVSLFLQKKERMIDAMSLSTVRRRNIAAFLLFVLWLSATAFAFWWFQFKDLRGFADEQWQERAVRFMGRDLQVELVETISDYIKDDHVVVVNFFQPGCQCNKFNISHLKELKARYTGRVTFLHLVPDGGIDTADLAALSKSGEVVSVDSNLKKYIPAAPSAAVLGPHDELIYFGPYSEGAVCGQGKNLVESVVDNSLEGEIKFWLNMRAYGCFCDWG